MTSKSAGLGSLAAATGLRALRAAPPLGRSLAGSAAGLGRATAAQAARAAPVAAGTARFAAGLGPGQGFAGTPGGGVASRGWAAARNTYNAAFKPLYPGLDRPAAERAILTQSGGLLASTTAARSVAGGVPPPLVPPRVFDVPRTLAAAAMRRGSMATTAATGGIAGYGLLKAYPDWIAGDVGRYAGMAPDQIADTQARMRQRMPAVIGEVAKQQVGLGDPSAFSRLHGAVIREALPQAVRSDIYYARQQHPWRFGLTDLMRSFTPGGLATTVATRLAASPTRPDVGAIVRRNLAARLPAIHADPEGTERSPFYPVWRDALLPREHMDSLGYAPFTAAYAADAGPARAFDSLLLRRPGMRRGYRRTADAASAAAQGLVGRAYELGPTGMAREHPLLYRVAPGMIANRYLGAAAAGGTTP